MDDIVNLINNIENRTSNSIRVCMPGKIESYDFKTQKASIKIDMMELYGDESTVDYPVISGVPVVFPSSGGASLTLPVKPNDRCMVIFADRDIGNWLLGGSGQKPDSTRMHALTDAIAIMGLRQFTKLSNAENNTDVLLQYSGSKIRLKPEGIVQIETADKVNIDTKHIIINCLDANINAADDINVKCTNATLNATGDVTTNCNNSILVAKNDVNVTCVNSKLTASGDVEVTCVNSKLIASGDVTTNCVNSMLIATGNVTVESVNTSIKASQNITLESTVDTNIMATKNVNITCETANITASVDIVTKSVNLTHTGKMQITGDVDFTGNFTVSGTSKLSGALTSETSITSTGGITNTGGTTTSNGVTLETHRHSYIDTIGEPPIPTPSTTGTPL